MAQVSSPIVHMAQIDDLDAAGVDVGPLGAEKGRGAAKGVDWLSTALQVPSTSNLRSPMPQWPQCAAPKRAVVASTLQGQGIG